MKYVDCFRAIARHRTDELVVTSAGNSGQAWWEATHDTEASFYLDASMSLSTMFASGLALAMLLWIFGGVGSGRVHPVLVVYLLGIIIALRRANRNLYQLVSGLDAVVKDTQPLPDKLSTINGALSQLLTGLLAVDGDLATVAKLFGR